MGASCPCSWPSHRPTHSQLSHCPLLANRLMNPVSTPPAQSLWGAELDSWQGTDPPEYLWGTSATSSRALAPPHPTPPSPSRHQPAPPPSLAPPPNLSPAPGAPQTSAPPRPAHCFSFRPLRALSTVVSLLFQPSKPEIPQSPLMSLLPPPTKVTSTANCGASWQFHTRNNFFPLCLPSRCSESLSISFEQCFLTF